MRIYLAGPLFTEAERTYLDGVAEQLEAAGHSCFVPHRQPLERFDAETIFAVDSVGIRGADAMVAWLDGPMVDDGTACEIGLFSELVRSNPDRHRGIVAFGTDWRLYRRRDGGVGEGGVNYFVAGAILASGTIVWSVEEVLAVLADWANP